MCASNPSPEQIRNLKIKMANLKQIDLTQPLEIYPSQTKEVNDAELIALSEKLNLAQMKVGSLPMQDLTIVVPETKTRAVAHWIVETGRLELFDRNLQGFAQRNDGTPLLTTWFSIEEAHRFFAPDSMCPELADMPNVLQSWVLAGADEVYIDGVELGRRSAAVNNT